MIVEKRIHPGYEEYKKMSKKYKKSFKAIFGKYQYIISDDKKKYIFSLIEFVREDFLYKGYKWEILCIKGNLFEDVERFKTRKEAMQRIENLIGENETIL